LDGSNQSHLSNKSHKSYNQTMPDRPLIPKHGGFRNLHAYKFVEVVHDATVIFCERFVDPRSRTTDQMIQAARSGKQNIAEGSMASATSKKTELKLTNVARASLIELQIDFEDYLRQHDLPIWDKEDPRCRKIRSLAFEPQSNQSNQSKKYRQDLTFHLYAKFFEKTGPEIAANAAITILNQATFLLNRLLAKLEQDFVEEGGFTERLYNKRTQARKSN